MKVLTSFQELDTLGAALVQDYFKKTHRWNSMSVDIEGFIKDYLCLDLVYECFAEEDKSKIGFSADGRTPLMVRRGGVAAAVIYPRDTLVIDQFLERREESGRRRFTMAHEAAHNILGRHVPMQMAAAFHSDYDHEARYSMEDMKRIFSMNEAFANRLGAAILMPLFLVEKAQSKYYNGQRIICYEGVFAQKEKLAIQKMANTLGVNYTAMVNRLKELNLLDFHPVSEYLQNDLKVRGAYDGQN